MTLKIIRTPPNENTVRIDSLPPCHLFRFPENQDLCLCVGDCGDGSNITYMNLTTASGPRLEGASRLVIRMEGTLSASDRGTPPLSLDVEAARRIGAALPLPSGLTDAEEELGRKGYPIQAIKSIRARTGKGLREAKEQYDAAGIPRP